MISFAIARHATVRGVRLLGFVLLAFGLVTIVAGTISGCGALFSWNGRHAVDERALDATPVAYPFRPEAGRRYTLAVQVVFDREGLPRRDGSVVVEAKMPLVVRARDEAGTKLAELTGWLDPEQPPNVLYGQSARQSRGPMPELVVERVVGPFITASTAPLTIEVDIGPDRVGTTRVVARRLVIHDDATPPTVRNAFLAAGGGGVAFVAGIVVLIRGWFRRRRGGFPRADAI
jgi:hypothetical protein